jgi:hypothetical protein
METFGRSRWLGRETGHSAVLLESLRLIVPACYAPVVVFVSALSSHFPDRLPRNGTLPTISRNLAARVSLPGFYQSALCWQSFRSGWRWPKNLAPRVTKAGP